MTDAFANRTDCRQREIMTRLIHQRYTRERDTSLAVCWRTRKTMQQRGPSICNRKKSCLSPSSETGKKSWFTPSSETGKKSWLTPSSETGKEKLSHTKQWDREENLAGTSSSAVRLTSSAAWDYSSLYNRFHQWTLRAPDPLSPCSFTSLWCLKLVCSAVSFVRLYSSPLLPIPTSCISLRLPKNLFLWLVRCLPLCLRLPRPQTASASALSCLGCQPLHTKRVMHHLIVLSTSPLHRHASQKSEDVCDCITKCDIYLITATLTNSLLRTKADECRDKY